jgi:hypothetical protein
MKNEKSCRPCFMKYDGQIFPQKAYIEIDDNGDFDYGYSGEIGNAIPADVFNNARIRWPVSSELTESEIEMVIERIKPRALKILETTEVVYGKRRLTEEASDIITDIEYELSIVSSNYDCFCQDDDCDYCNNKEC